MICHKAKSANHCLTELFSIYQNKHWTIRRRDDHIVVPSSNHIKSKIDWILNSLTIGWGNLAENSQIWLLFFQPSLFLTTSSELNCLKSMPPYCLYLSPSLNLHKIKAARNKCHTSKEQRTCFKCKPSIKVRIIAMPKVL